jgi:NarL family two-component system response regulator LiaR
LFDLLSQVPLGEVVLTPSLASRILVKVTRNGRSKAASATMLSERELEVLNFVARGSSNQEIAEALFISVNTVKVHIRNILQKLNVGNRTEATARALQAGLVSPMSGQGSLEPATD